MDAATRGAVQRRAENRCEYCLLRQEHSELRHHVEHITAKQHGGSEELENLALACHRCNLQKGPNLTGIDPLTGRLVPLFHPRRDRWVDHFVFRGVRIVGITPAGRATVHVLAMNDARRLELRSQLVANSGL
ncbi:MAG TPA: HNH endonuclease signature motif containing protein [Terriglobia bacterium]|nr:HNH endonuclease signature motif containing protein [Terriglobia bacterium]